MKVIGRTALITLRAQKQSDSRELGLKADFAAVHLQDDQNCLKCRHETALHNICAQTTHERAQRCWRQKTEASVTGRACSPFKPLKIGGIELANRVLLAPMSGVTDAPFRRLTARLGAGLVVSEMTASDDLVNGRPMSRPGCGAAGIGPHVVQLAGCENRWMAEAARLAEAAGADIIDINMGCPARHVTGGQSGSALMRDLHHAT